MKVFKILPFLPKLIVFDLDYTLWPFCVDVHLITPFRRCDNGDIVDARNFKIKPYPQVPDILRQLQAEGFILGIASRCSQVDSCYQLIHLLQWKSYFKYTEIYPGNKLDHFQCLKSKSGINLKDMIFFDDDYRNVNLLSVQCVLSILVKNGVTKEIIEEGLKQYSAKKMN